MVILQLKKYIEKYFINYIILIKGIILVNIKLILKLYKYKFNKENE